MANCLKLNYRIARPIRRFSICRLVKLKKHSLNKIQLRVRRVFAPAALKTPTCYFIRKDFEFYLDLALKATESYICTDLCLSQVIENRN